MQFPHYVPAGARAHIDRTLYGDKDGGHWKGILAFIAEYRSEGRASETADELEREANCVERFAQDPRMQDIYAELQKVFTTESQYAEFLQSAWAAKMDYGHFRQ